VKITHRIAEFVASTPTAAIPPEAREQARRAVLDTLGVMLAGSREEASIKLAALVREQRGAEEAAVFGHNFRAPANEAALVNGTSAHALDFDDVSVTMRGHPSVPLLPAVLALGEKLGSSGSELTGAFVFGFEVECKLGSVIGGPHYALGWHPTATFGTIGAAAASARLLGLDVDRTRMTLGIAASLAGGARRNFGSMTKPLHAGWAAHNGVIAASLALRGFTADNEALEAPDGWLHAASGGVPVDTSPLERLGNPWEILSPGIDVKLYPCCYFTHVSIDAALEISAHVAQQAAVIEGVRVSVSPGTMMVLRREPPQTGLEGKFSLEYCVAAALADGDVSLATFEDSAVARPEVCAIMHLVGVTEDAPPASAPLGGSSVVEVVFAHGEPIRSHRVDIPRGAPKNPLSWSQLAEKFRDCATPVLSASRTESVIKLTQNLDDLADVRELVAAFRADTVHA